VWLGLFAAVAILIWLEARGCERVSLAGTIICAQNVDPARLKMLMPAVEPVPIGR